jgi:hypothetical protein
LFGARDGEFGADGLMLKPVRPMKNWKLTYKEKMWWVTTLYNFVIYILNLYHPYLTMNVQG